MKKKLNIIILIFITILVLYFSLKDDFSSIVNQIINMNIWYLLVAFLLLILFWIFRSYPMYSFCKKINNFLMQLLLLQQEVNLIKYII